MINRRTLAATVVVLLTGLYWPLAGSAVAAAPSTQAWWNAANQGIAPPAPPDVPADGLLIQGGGTRPPAADAPSLAGTPAGTQAVSALTFVLADGESPQRLTLRIVGDPTLSTTVSACPLTGSYEPVQNGPFAAVPSYDCTAAIPATVDAAAATLVFADGLDRITTSGVLAVVLVPGDLDRVVIAKPGPDALTVRPGFEAPPFASSPPSLSAGESPSPSATGEPFTDAGTSEPPPFLSAGDPGLGQSPQVSLDAEVANPSPVLAAAPEVAGPVTGPLAGPSIAATNRTGAAVAEVADTTRALLILALIGVGVAYVVLDKRPGVPAVATRAATSPPGRGVGRFRRERDGPPVSL